MSENINTANRRFKMRLGEVVDPITRKRDEYQACRRIGNDRVDYRSGIASTNCRSGRTGSDETDLTAGAAEADGFGRRWHRQGESHCWNGRQVLRRGRRLLIPLPKHAEVVRHAWASQPDDELASTGLSMFLDCQRWERR
jgi:hypothetical protein